MKKWESPEAFFEKLNNTCSYLVLRNYDAIQTQLMTDAHADIDFLCDDLDAFVEAAGAERRDKGNAPHHNRIDIAGTLIPIDVRWTGDGYYDEKWERAMLEARRLFDGFCYVMSEEDLRYSLIYHALIQKKTIAPDYVKKISELTGIEEEAFDRKALLADLEAFMKKKGYSYVCPRYPGTAFYTEGTDPELRKKEPVFSVYRKIWRLARRKPI